MPAIYDFGGCYVLTMHPFVIGRPSRIRLLDRLIQFMKGFDGVWFATLEQIAEHALSTGQVRYRPHADLPSRHVREVMSLSLPPGDDRCPTKRSVDQSPRGLPRAGARDLADLFRLIAQPSISAQNIGVRECADLFVDVLRDAGFSARLMPTPAHPVVYAEWLGAPGKPTVLIYGHYDVQPPEPLDEWLSPPFEPTVRDGKLFARGAGDNKGQIFAQIAAARAWLEVVGDLPVNVKFLIEGEEETGSPHLSSFVAEHRDLLAADLVYTSDGPVHDDAHPQVVYGVRGLLYVELRARGASHDLHSGNWGGLVPNPAWTLVQLLATMRDDTGRVIDPRLLRRRATADTGGQARRWPVFRSISGGPGDGRTRSSCRRQPSLGYFDRLMTTPTLNIAGFTSGYGGPGAKTVIPSTATVKMDMRLVPTRARTTSSRSSRRTWRDTRRTSRCIGWEAWSHPTRRSNIHCAGSCGGPWRLDSVFRPIDVPLLGGSLPDAVFTKTLGLPSFLVPYANADERNHAPNENIELSRFFAGIRTAAALFACLAELTRHARERYDRLDRGAASSESNETHRSPQRMLDAVALALEPGAQEAGIVPVRIELPQQLPAPPDPAAATCRAPDRARTAPSACS